MIPLFFLIPFLGTMGAMPQASQTEIAQVVDIQQTKPATLLVDEVMKEFNEGKYRQFLSRLDKEFEKDRTEFQMNPLLDERKKVAALPAKHPKEAAAYAEASESLLKQRDQALIELCMASPTSPESTSVKNMIFLTLSTEQRKSLDYLYSLRSLFKGDGKTPLENELIRLDIEYWLKALSLDAATLEQKESLEISMKKQIALDLEKLEKMKDAALKDPDSAAGHAILVAYGVYPKHKAVLLEEKRLNLLAKGISAPKTSFEEKAKVIMQSFNEKHLTLVNKYFPSN
ncbi:MAG: hypothetical protein KBC64_05850 [Simkaniaceae bacterium]|nr:hypothetical protein [Simkaniaceae bacterium]